MIKEKKVLISINSANITKFRELGYKIDKLDTFTSKTEIEVSVEHLSRRSSVLVTAICKCCDKERQLKYKKYMDNFERRGFYSCFGCKNIKRKETCIDRFGVDSYSKTDEFKKAYKETCIVRFGDHPMRVSEIRDRVIQTNLDRYGVEWYFMLDHIKEQNREWMSSDEFK
jgi:hypothetical protein